jgi:hypothetical protein
VVTEFTEKIKALGPNPLKGYTEKIEALGPRALAGSAHTDIVLQKQRPTAAKRKIKIA